MRSWWRSVVGQCLPGRVEIPGILQNGAPLDLIRLNRNFRSARYRSRYAHTGGSDLPIIIGGIY